MEREKLLCVDLAAGNVEKEINLTVTDSSIYCGIENVGVSYGGYH